MEIEKKRKIQLEFYCSIAKNFNAKYHRENRCHRKKIELISESLKIKPDETVLESGMGTGIHAKWLLEMHKTKGIKFIGCDLSPEMIKEAHQRLLNFPEITLFVAPGESLPISNAYVDKAYISGSLHHFADRRKGIEELVRVVRPGGIIAISEPNIVNPLNLILTLLNFRIERGQFHTHPGALRRLFSGLPVEIMSHKLFNFTPPFPKFTGNLFNKIDDFFSSFPLICRIASMNIIVVKRI